MKNLTSVQKILYFAVIPLAVLVLSLIIAMGTYFYTQNSSKNEATKIEKSATSATKKTLYGSGNYNVGDEIVPGSYYIVVKSGKHVWLNSPEWVSLEKDNPYKVTLKENDKVSISASDDEKVELELIPVEEYKPSENKNSTTTSSDNKNALTKAKVEEFANGLVGKKSKLAQELVYDFYSQYDDAYVYIDAVDSEGVYASTYDSGLTISEVTSVSESDDSFKINVIVTKE